MAQRAASLQTGKIATPVVRTALALALIGGLSACSGGLGLGQSDKEPNLMNIDRGQRSPDEFAIVPNKPIEIPEDLAALPAPTPGAANRVDATPKEDAVAALGGNPSRLQDSGGVPRSDGTLVSAASRFGVQPGIREELAAADLEFRRRNDGRLLERLFNVTVYYKAYEKQSLDQYAELERWRRAGARTVAAPPDPTEE